MKERSQFLGIGQSTVGQGEAHPYLDTSAAGAHHRRKRLRKKGRLRLDPFRLFLSRKAVHLHQHDAIVPFELPPSVRRPAIFRHGIDAGDPVKVNETGVRPLQGRETATQQRDVLPLVFLLHPFQERFHGADTTYICLLFFSDYSYLHLILCIKLLQKYKI